MDISVIIPVYNTPHELLNQNIDSLLSQKGDYEFIYINDGSSDLWIDNRLHEIESVDQRVKYIKKENTGVSDTRNRGIQEALGEYITFVDSDDQMTEGSLCLMLNYAKETNADVSIFGIEFGNLQESVKKILSKKEILNILWSVIAYRTSQYSRKGLLIDSPFAKLFRRSLIINNKVKFVSGLFVSEDAIFDATVYELSRIISVDNTIVYKYVTNENSLTHSFNYRYVDIIPSVIEAKEKIVKQYHGNDVHFFDALAIRTIIAIMNADHCYFSISQKGKTFVQVAKEFRKLLSEPIVKKYIQHSKYSILSQNELPGVINKVKLFIYKTRLVELDMLIFRLQHLLKK